MKRDAIVMFILTLIIAGFAGSFIWQRNSATVSAASVRVQTATVERGTIAATVSAAGNVSTVKSTSLTFQVAGKVAQVNVMMGDQVKAGQVLMQLDTTDLQLAFRTAQANLASQQASYDASVQKNAQNNNQLIVAKTQLEKARIALEQAQGAYNQIAWRGDVGLTTQATNLRNATIEYESSLASYKMTEATINDSALKTAVAELEKDKIALEQAQRNLDKTKIVAPYDCFIAQANLNPGDTAGTNTAAIVLADLNALQVKVTVAEVDIARIKAGQTAQVTLDALQGKTYTAQVLTIGPVGTVTQGVVNYPVTLSVVNTDGAIKPGMTANLAISIEQRENVLRIPSRAVRATGNQRTVTIMYKGQSIAMPIVTGMSGDQYIEVVSGLREGDQIVLQQTTTRQTGGGGFGVPGAGPNFVIKP